MEALLVSGIAFDKDQARVTMHWHARQTGCCRFSSFGAISEAGILVDMIVQNTSNDGHTDMTFTISKEGSHRRPWKSAALSPRSTATAISPTAPMWPRFPASASACAITPASRPGLFPALTKEGINILMISTSEIKITILIDEKYLVAVRILHDTFGLDWDIN